MIVNVQEAHIEDCFVRAPRRGDSMDVADRLELCAAQRASTVFWVHGSERPLILHSSHFRSHMLHAPPGPLSYSSLSIRAP